jgi:hypothetical protein
MAISITSRVMTGLHDWVKLCLGEQFTTDGNEPAASSRRSRGSSASVCTGPTRAPQRFVNVVVWNSLAELTAGRQRAEFHALVGDPACRELPASPQLHAVVSD